MSYWPTLTIAIVGGDRREQEIARCAAATCASVRAYGFPWPEGGIAGVEHAVSLGEALDCADFALFPIPGIAPDGALFSPSMTERIIPDKAALSRMKTRAAIILGWGDDKLKAAAKEVGISLHEYEWDRSLMLLRGPAIVEGMLGAIIANTDITIHRSTVVQIGQGAIGALATRSLIALGARVHVAARNAEQRAAAFAAGAESCELDALPRLLGRADIVLSSVPALVLDAAMMVHIARQALLIDLSAPPGSIDHDAARAHGLKLVWARGMGNRAPVTVGRSQWSGIEPRIEAILAARASQASHDRTGSQHP